MNDIRELLQDNWSMLPDRFSGLTFLHKDNKRILYSTRDARIILSYTSRNPGDSTAKADWQELQELLSGIARYCTEEELTS